MKTKSQLIFIILIVALALSPCSTIKDKEEAEKEKEKLNVTQIAFGEIKTMSSFRRSMIMNTNMDMDAPAPSATEAGNTMWTMDSVHLKRERTTKEQVEAPSAQATPDDNKKNVIKGLSITDDVIYGLLSSISKSSLKYSSYIKEKKYFEYAQKIGVDAVVNVATRLVFRVIKGPIGNVIQLGLFLGATLLNCKGKTINASFIHCTKQILKLIGLIIVGIISGKLTKNIAAKAIIYGIFSYFAEIGISTLFTILFA